MDLIKTLKSLINQYGPAEVLKALADIFRIYDLRASHLPDDELLKPTDITSASTRKLRVEI